MTYHTTIVKMPNGEFTYEVLYDGEHMDSCGGFDTKVEARMAARESIEAHKIDCNGWRA